MNKDKLEREFALRLGPMQTFIKGVVRRHLDDYRYVEDCAQEVLLKAWKHFEHLPKVDSSLRSWLFTTSKRAAMDHRRAMMKITMNEHTRGEVDFAANTIQYGEGKVPHLLVCEPQHLVDPFVIAEVKKFLSDLPEHHREALVLDVAGLSYDQIANATSSSLGTVRSRLYYARRKAKRALSCHL